MILKKKYNNNIVMCLDENGEDVILIGLGIALNRKLGQEIDQSRIERRFVLDTKETVNKYNSILKTVPLRYMMLASRIVDRAEKILEIGFSDEIYIAICDHLNFALRRYAENKLLKNTFLWEIKQYYKKEFNAGLEALKIIEQSEGVRLVEDEAGFFALHFINGEKNRGSMDDTFLSVKILEDVVKFITYQLHYTVDMEDINYQRFITHLRFLTQRILENKQVSSEDETICRIIRNECPKEFRCASMAGKYIEKQYNYAISENEVAYLALHIHRLMNRGSM